MQSTIKRQNFSQLPFSDVKTISTLNPLRGKEVADAMRETLATVSPRATQDGITEDDVNRMVREVRDKGKPG